MRKRFFSFLVIMLASGLLASTALAQGIFTGTVADDEGNLFEGATVVMENPNARPPRVETQTDASGRFSMIGLNSGGWVLTVEAEGYHPHQNPTLRISQGGNPPFNVTLERIKHPLEIALGEAALDGLDPVALEDSLRAADAAFNDEQWEQAITNYQDILTKLPMINVLHMQIATAYRRLARYDEAIASFEQAAAGDSDLKADVETEIARVRMAMGDFEAAQVALTNAASGENATREDLYNLGELEFAKGDMDAAIVFYQQAAAADPNWGKPPFKLALVALNQGDMEGAKAFFAQAIEAEPDSAEAATAKATLESLP
jgi:Flp pilus assembly protein TadD